MSDNMKAWKEMSQPPKDALKEIKAGRLRGMSDISPQWRMEIMTKVFGPCGIGWKYEITSQWLQEVSDEQVFAFTNVNLYIKVDGEWSDPIPGTGGSALITKERSGLYSSDEAHKMALTDALSVAMKAVGVGADIYRGKWTGKYYKGEDPKPSKISDKQVKALETLLTKTDSDVDKFLSFFKIKELSEMTSDKYEQAYGLLKAKDDTDADY